MSSVTRMERLDRIKKAIDDESDVYLSEDERREKSELLSVVSMLLDPDYITADVISTLMQEHGLSQRTAYRRLSDAKFVFGNVFSRDGSMERMKALQRAEEIYMISKDRQNVDGMLRANDQIMKIVGADNAADAIDPTKLEPSLYKAVLPSEAKKLLSLLAASGSVDIADMMMRAGLVKDALMLEEPTEDEDA